MAQAGLRRLAPLLLGYTHPAPWQLPECVVHVCNLTRALQQIVIQQHLYPFV
jgi:hypothetical protein